MGTETTSQVGIGAVHQPETTTMPAEIPTALLRRVYAEIDAILRGKHAGWDQALAALRTEIRKELVNV